MRFCTFHHSRKVDDIWIRGERETIEVVRLRNGVISVKLRCICGELSGGLPKDVVWEWLDPFGAIVFRTHDGVQCVVATCTSEETEYHHFAPRNTFLLDADDWPILPLCPAHHREWHQRMDGYRWHKAAS